MVFHADDLGQNSAIDDGIVDALANGVLTSTAVLANGPNAENAIQRVLRLEAARRTDRHLESNRRFLLDDPVESFDLGIHLNLTQGRPLTDEQYPSELLDEQGCFAGRCKLFATLLRSRGRFLAALEAELAEQIVWVLDHGVRPTHVNGHQYIELFPGVSDVVCDLVARFSIEIVRLPIERRLWTTALLGSGISVWTLAHIKRRFAVRFARHVRVAKLRHPDGFFGTALAGRMTISALSRRLVTSVNEELVEIGMHPGHVPDDRTADRSADGWHDPLAAQRPAECSLLCSTALVDLLLDRGLRLGRLSSLAIRS